MPPSVLVLGGSGFLGQYVVDALTKDGQYNVMILSKSSTRLGNHRSPAAPPPLAAADPESAAPADSSASSQDTTAATRRRGIVKYVQGNLATGEGLEDALHEAAKLGGILYGDSDDEDDSDDDSDDEEEEDVLDDQCVLCGCFHDDEDEEDEDDDDEGEDLEDDPMSNGFGFGILREALRACKRKRNRRYPGLAAVVNCAAVSSPDECERDPVRSAAVNIPTKLVEAMHAFGMRKAPFFVHVSTDQIYSGERDVDDPVDFDDEYFDIVYASDGGEEEVTDEWTGEKYVRKKEKSRVAHSLWYEGKCEKQGPDGGYKPGPFEPLFTAADGDGDDDDEEDSDEDEDSDDSYEEFLARDDGSHHCTDFDPRATCVDPINAYAKQKADAEWLLTTKYPRSVCLRSSVMYGRLPRDRDAVKGTRFLQFVDRALRESGEGGKTSACFFEDEFRSFVAVTDVAAAVVACVRKWGRPMAEDGGPMSRSFHWDDYILPTAVNVGGPERLSRADFARLVAENRGYDRSVVRAVPRSSVERRAPSPRDISMDVSRLSELLEIEPKSVAEALKEMPPDLE